MNTSTPTPLAGAIQIHSLLRNTHYVLDLETIGKSPYAAIASIGCVRIERGVISDSFYRRVDSDTSIAWGGESDSSTFQWWLQQGDAARAEIYDRKGRLSINDALQELIQFIGQPPAAGGEVLVWGNGATFDNVIISTALQRSHIERPWPYWNDRDLRTIADLYPEAKASTEFVGIKHHALDDALYEAHILCKAISLHTQGDRHVQA